MAVPREIQIIELAGLRLDRPLVRCGELGPEDRRVAVDAQLTATRQAFQSAIDRRVDLILMHSEILSADSSAGCAPWFLARQIEACQTRGIPVVWIERHHNDWMQRFVDTPANLFRVSLGEIRTIETHGGLIQIAAGSPASADRVWLAERRETIIGWDVPADHELREVSDLILNAGDREAVARLHTLKPHHANSAEPLNIWPIGELSVTCGVSASVTEHRLADSLSEEIDAAAGRYFAAHPQTQLLLVDLIVRSPAAESSWEQLGNGEFQKQLRTELTRISRHPGCRIRSVTPRLISRDADHSMVSLVDSIWNQGTNHPGHYSRLLSEVVPESVMAPDWTKSQRVVPDHPLSIGARESVIGLLRSAS